MKSWLIFVVRAAASVVMFVLGCFMLFFSTFNFDWVVFVLAVLFTLSGYLAFPRVPNSWRREPPSQKQIAYASKLGIEVPHGISKGELSDMISSATGR